MASVAGSRLRVTLACLVGCFASVGWTQELFTQGAGTGRFAFTIEKDGEAEARRIDALVERAWAVWREPMGISGNWPSDLAVRLVDSKAWTLTAEPDRRVTVDADGVVRAWIRVGGEGESAIARDRRWLQALAAAAWTRQAVSAGRPTSTITTPAWLIEGAAEQALIAAMGNPALRNTGRQTLARADWRPSLVTVWHPESARRAEIDEAAAVAFWDWMRTETRRDRGAWSRLVSAALAGDRVESAFASAFGERASSATSRDLELWWQTEAAAESHATSSNEWLPADVSRRLLLEMDRLVLRPRAASGSHTGENSVDASAPEVALELGGRWADRDDTIFRSVRTQRAGQLTLMFSRMHPFYRNAAGSLGRSWLALDGRHEKDWRAARDDFASDMAQGAELERASRDALDRAEGRASP